MLPKIMITSPYPEFAKKTMVICHQLSVKPTIIEAVLEDAVKAVLGVIKTEDVEVVVSRGATATALMNFTNIPVITAEADEFDVLKALLEAKKICKENIAFLGSFYLHSGHNFEDFEEILGTSIRQYTFKDFSELKTRIGDACKDGVKVLVTGSELAIELAEEMGIKGVIIKSSHRAIVQAIERANEVIRIRKIDRKYTQRLHTLMSNVKEAILILDEKEHIMFINDEARNILKIKKDVSIINRAIRDTDNVWFDKVYEDGSPCFDILKELDHTQVIINRVHVKTGKEYFGCVITLQELQRLQHLEQKTRKKLYQKGLIARFSFGDIIGKSDALLDAIEMAKKFGETNSTIVLYGESGTGKEMFAQSIHQVSPRRKGPFVAVNCAALPENLLESELFGYEEGAFTGAKKGGKAGLFELAHGGTIFLDEIGKIPLSLQGRLLRVLQEKEVMHLGGDKVIPINIRVIAATNVDLHEKVQKGEFRDDLYYRINVLRVNLPPLRERNGDLDLLFNYFVTYFNEIYGKQLSEIPSKLQLWIKSYHWPGNVRELSNFTERMAILSNGKSIDKSIVRKLIKINDKVISSSNGDFISVQHGTLEEMKRELVTKLEQKTGFNQTRLARELGISRNTLGKILSN